MTAEMGNRADRILAEGWVTTPRRARRFGVSLLEVMFAIGVVGVGLLGVTAILPIALSQVGRGNVEDRAARLALNAVQEFHTRGMAAPETWRSRNGNSINITTSSSPTWKTPFAIDPQFIAASTNFVSATNYDPIQFPYPNPYPPPAALNPGEPRMLRVTLQNMSTLAADAGRELLASTIFQLDDEQVFDIPPDKLVMPIQQFSNFTYTSSGNTVTMPGERQFEGLFSWMATVAPKLDGYGYAKDLYTLSIVVFHRRNPQFAMFEDADTDGVEDTGEGPTYSEVVVDVVAFPGGGYRGGDVLLQAGSAAELDVKDGDWLMLLGTFDGDGALTTVNDQFPLFRWYRVVAADSDPRLNGSLYQLDVTLQGPDWVPNVGANMLPMTTTTPPIRTRAAIVRDVVSVYEKSIRFEGASLY